MTDTERLKAWMDANGYNSKELSHALGYNNNVVGSCTDKGHPISYWLKVEFLSTFGDLEFGKVFTDLPMPNVEDRAALRGIQARCQAVIQIAIRHGEVPRQIDCYCLSCHNTAHSYHHESYHLNDRLCVIPLCRSCHRRVHTGKLTLPPLGVVPTHVGLIRIAIAGLDRVVAG